MPAREGLLLTPLLSNYISPRKIERAKKLLGFVFLFRRLRRGCLRIDTMTALKTRLYSRERMVCVNKNALPIQARDLFQQHKRDAGESLRRRR